jgi:uncharacterized iron-regulated membrane protein
MSRERKALYGAVWRWHFYAGVYVAPFLVLLPLTGLVMLAAQPLERWQLGDTLKNAAGGGQATHQARLEAARAAIPGGVAVRYQPGRTPADATRVMVTVGGAPHSVFVDAGTARVRGAVEEGRLLPVIAHRLHGTLLIGEVGDRLLEIAASLGIVLLVSGIYLWLPRGTGLRESLRIGRETGRVAFRDLHKATGAVLAPALAFYLLSGLAWTGVWGGRFVQTWSTLGAARAAPGGSAGHAHGSANDQGESGGRTHGALDAGTTRVVPWNLEQARLPASTGSGERAPRATIGLDEAIAAARRQGIGERFWVGLPEGERGVYTVAQTAMNADVTDPTRELIVHVDQYSGAVVGQAGWNDYDLLARAMAAGIPLHQGSLGGWSLAGAVAVCLATLTLSVSGLVMWWLRRPARAFRLAAPPRPALLEVPRATWATAVVLGVLFPLAGATLIAVALLDWAVVRHVSALRRILS